MFLLCDVEFIYYSVGYIELRHLHNFCKLLITAVFENLNSYTRSLRLILVVTKVDMTIIGLTCKRGE